MSLSDEFSKLAEGATPGEWKVVRSAPEHGRALVHGKFIEVHVDKRQTMEDPTPDAAFIAFCGTHRAEIGAAMRLAEAVDESMTAPVAVPMRIRDALTAFRAAAAGEGAK